MPSSVSLEEGNEYVNQIRKAIKNLPEVDTVISQHGRPDDGTDATGFFNAEFFVPLKPEKNWRKGVNKDVLSSELSSTLIEDFPGIEFNFSQYIQDNVQEAVSGVKGENSIKLFGSDLQTLTKTAERIKAVMKTVPGITDLSVFSSVGQPTIRIDIDRFAAGHYGFAPGDINSAVQTAIGGQAAGDAYEESSDRHFPIIVRLAQHYRQDSNVCVVTRGGHRRGSHRRLGFGGPEIAVGALGLRGRGNLALPPAPKPTYPVQAHGT